MHPPLNEPPYERPQEQATERLAAIHAARARLYWAFAELLRWPIAWDTVSAIRSVLTSPAARCGGHELGEVQWGLLCALRQASPEVLRYEQSRLYSSRPFASEASPVEGNEGPEEPRSVDLSCEPTFAAARDEAFELARRPPGGDRIVELEVLCALAEESARLTKECDAEGLERLWWAQSRLLSSHAGVCLGSLAAQLEQSRGEMYRSIGRALGQLIGEEMRLLVSDALG